MTPARSLLLLPLAAVVVACALSERGDPQPAAADSAHAAPPAADRATHVQRVMTSRFCGECHPAIYAEHAANTHGRAFTDEEVRLATGRFDHGDCIRCHTPRPVFETGIGQNPITRHYGLEEGNSCMTCHWRPNYDYSAFHGGAQCRDAFDPRVGEVEACASCHRNHGTPYQWEIAPEGKAAGRECVTCHMPRVNRPVAVGQPPRLVRSHVFPGSRSEKQLRRAYKYDAALDGNEVVVTVTNKGAGHNFPTELKQRSVESLIVVRDLDGREVSRSRMVFRDPYKRPYGLHLPVNTQIPSGESRQHRVPLKVASGTVDCELHYKLYFPIDDHHPDLARQLEAQRLFFEGVTPSDRPVESAPDVRVVVPDGIPVDAASPADLVDYARPPIGTVVVSVPDGSSPADIAALIELFQFPVPEANARARDRLVALGAAAVPALIEALGSWDNKTWNQAMAVLARMPADLVAPALTAALSSDQLYVRLHSRKLIANAERFGAPVRDRATPALLVGLVMVNALDRASSAEALGKLDARSARAALRGLLADDDPDVVRAASLSLARLDDREAAPSIRAAMHRSVFAETRCDLAIALATLGDPSGIPVLLDGLDHADDLIREDFFEGFFAVTGLHMGYDPFARRDQRLAAISALQQHWAAAGGAELLRRPPAVGSKADDAAWKLVAQIGGGDGQTPAGDDGAIEEQLVAMGEDAVPALLRGLKYPAGFAAKRALLCKVLGRIAGKEAAPALASALRDPVLGVAAWACWALERIADPATLPALRRYHAHLLSLRRDGAVPASAGHADALVAQSASARLHLGDEAVRSDLLLLLLSDDAGARRTAIDALAARYGERRGYDPDADAPARREAAARWSR
jgi:HEAT repeat protein